MNIFGNLIKSAQDMFKGWFKKQEVISPLPDNYDTGLTDQFGRPMAVPTFDTTPKLTFNPTAPNSLGITTSSGQGSFSSPGGNRPDTELEQLAKMDRNPPQEGRYQELLRQQNIPDVQTTVDGLLQAMVNPLQAEIESWWKRLDEYDKNNPFAFDEALARASAGERLNPYFNATMNEFMTGIRRSSTRSFEDMTRTIGELSSDASKLSDKERFATQEAIRSSEEGFAGSGLFFSGRRQRASGVEEVQGLQRQEDISTNLGRGISSTQRSNTRLQEDLALQEARQKRLTEAERTTALETDVAKAKREAELQRGLERLQFAGKIPGASPVQQMQLENQFMSGLV